MRGEAHAAIGELEAARRELYEAAKLWRRSGDGMHEQAALLELERVRKNIEAESHSESTGRLVVFHAAPLVESVDDRHEHHTSSGDSKIKSLQPILFSKRLGLRAWRKLRTVLGSLRREIKVSLELATVENLAQVLQQSDQPMLHFLPSREYTNGLSMES